MSIRPYEIFHLASDAALFVTLVATLTYGTLALLRLHRRRDPARRVFSWVKLAWGVFTL